ncbi:MAG: spore cortex biosynthesis protein YabQ [Lachnospiraceae bacterium]
MLSLLGELAILKTAFFAGMIVVAVYDCIRVFRRIVKHKLYVVAIEDFIFWVSTGIYLFIQIYKTSGGSIRWYFILGVGIGMIVFQWIFYKAEKTYIKIKNSKEKY